MRKILCLLLLLPVFSFAQTPANPYPKTITVTGSAEMEIVPDEIYVIVDLREYEKKGQGKVEIDVIKSAFLNGVRAAGIADSLVSIATYDGYVNPWYRRKNKKQQELYASISYLIKLRTAQQVDDIVNRLDDDATQNFYIAQTSHSRLAEYRKQLKINAVKAAKEKAGYLSASINEQLGDAVTITEPVEYTAPAIYNQARAANVAIKEFSQTNTGNQPDFRKMKLRYDVTTVFALK
jgi:uncharacterized protein